ncbi:hypothetical protein L249_2000 [Ophiocordyceps polyrhachis-furcata BCC 54312]|uniref:Translation initiation factor eIF2B subunit beta n=1 Tax=Ophiocordyceps polyrhachis-furcata BCC 54312 TaxID=1330021 RepID=A0A367LQK0_9HYPO|nr:hypothetical protein L249_2000 [Ophiocordyceps polyrhachis-furcata BCC 54312]
MPSAAVNQQPPNLDKYLKSLKGFPLESSIERLTSRAPDNNSLLKRRQIRGSECCAIATAHILLQVVARGKWQDVDGLLEAVYATGRRLVDAQPTELVVANIVRRVLALIRDEAAEDRNEPSSEPPSIAPMSPVVDATPPTQKSWSLPETVVARQDSVGDFPPSRAGLFPSYSSSNIPKSLFHLLSASPPSDFASAPSSSFRNSGTSTPTGRAGPVNNSQESTLRSEVIDGIEEILDEISQVDDQIAAQADAQIHPGDHVLVHRPSPTVQRFILRAALKRQFTVLITAEMPRPHSAPTDPHAAFAKKLSAAGINSIVLRSAASTAYMPRIDKVILGVRAILANGGVVADSGAATLARAAHQAGRAVVALAGIYKLSPEHPFDEESLIEWASPSTFVGFDDGPLVQGVEVRSAATELVPPELVDMYMTNLGTHSRDHLASLIADHYKPEDAGFHLSSDG